MSVVNRSFGWALGMEFSLMFSLLLLLLLLLIVLLVLFGVGDGDDGKGGTRFVTRAKYAISPFSGRGQGRLPFRPMPRLRRLAATMTVRGVERAVVAAAAEGDIVGGGDVVEEGFVVKGWVSGLDVVLLLVFLALWA